MSNVSINTLALLDMFAELCKCVAALETGLRNGNIDNDARKCEQIRTDLETQIGVIRESTKEPQ